VTPAVSVLTTIGLDHTDVLGGTIEQIAMDKAGIIKPGVPAVSMRQRPEAEALICAEAKRKGAPLYSLPLVRVLSSTLAGQAFESDGRRYELSGIGEMQPEVAALAAMTARVMGFGEDAIRKGLAQAVIPCRAQYIPGVPDMLLDGAHNHDSVTALCRTLDRHFPDRRKTLLFACMKNKDYADMAAQLAPRFEQVVVTRVDKMRGVETQTLQELFDSQTACRTVEDPLSAYETAAETVRDSGSLLVVCGSFYLAGKIKSKV